MSIFSRFLNSKALAEAKHDEIADPSKAVAFGNRIIFYGLGIFIAWATLVPLDEGIPATGTIAVESMRMMVSSFSGGSVATVHVRENQSVKKGDPLITFDSTKTRVTYNTAIQEYIAASAKLVRLRAEQTSADRLDFPDELLVYAGQMGRKDYLTAQEQLFRIRRETLQGELRILRESLSTLQAQITGARNQLDARTHQASLLKKEVQELRPLVEAGYTSKTTLMAQERALAEVGSISSELQARMASQTSTSSEIRMRILQREQEFRRDVDSQIVDTEREVSTLRERLVDAQRDLEKVVVRAPVSGQVVALQAQTIGAAVTPGSKILEIVPAGEKLLVDVKVPDNLINRVVPGLTTHLQISAFIDNPSLVIEGAVLSVSSDKHTPAGNEKPYYLARIEITPKGMAELHGRELRPGMPVSAVIKTGERSLLMYLMAPLTRRAFSALQEQ